MKLNHLSSTEGRPIFCHFLNRELNQSVGSAPSDDDHLLFIRLLSIFHNEPLFCNISQLFESTSTDHEIQTELRDLIQAQIFIAHSDYGDIGEFLHSRRTLYGHDAKRYGMYFEAPPSALMSIQPDKIGLSQDTTGYIDRELAKWLRKDGFVLNSDYSNPADVTRVKAIIDDIGKILSDRGEQGITYALFKSRGIEDLQDPSVEGGLRRILSALYVESYRSAYGAVIPWGLVKFADFERNEDAPHLNFQFMQLILKRTGLFDLLSLRPNFGLIDRIDAYGSNEKAALVRSVLRLSFSISTLLKNEPVGSVLPRHRLTKKLEQLWTASNANIEFSDSHSLKEAMKFASMQIDGVTNYICTNDDFVKGELDLHETKPNRLLILTATDLEDKVLRDTFKANGIGESRPDYSNAVSINNFGTTMGVEVLNARSSAGSSGPSGSQATLTDAIEQLNPDFIISGGICFGLRKDKQKLGDLAISTKVSNYELQKVIQFGPFGRQIRIPRGDRPSCSPILLDRSLNLRRTWNKCDLHEGLFMSGDKLSNSRRLIRQLKKMEPEAIAGEMEGSGLTATSERKRKHWIIVKGICDWGFGKTDGAQVVAATNSFNFISEIVVSGSLNLNSTSI